jgi:peroxiredoxin Q/BCP
MKPTRLLPLAALGLGLALPALPGPARADHEEKHYFVRVGDPAPRFELLDDQGKKWKLSDHLGKRLVVLFFYMGDYFPQSAREVCAFRDDLDRLKRQGAEVVGISGDVPASHELFKRSYDLNYPLLCDTRGEVSWRFGMPASAGGSLRVPGPDGEEVTITRGSTPAFWTWVIGPDGRVLDKFTKVKPDQESKRVLALLRKWRDKR